MENHKTVLKRWTLCFSSYRDYELKVKLWWVGASEGKESAFFETLILSEGKVLTFVFYFNA